MPTKAESWRRTTEPLEAICVEKAAAISVALLNLESVVEKLGLLQLDAFGDTVNVRLQQAHHEMSAIRLAVTEATAEEIAAWLKEERR